MFLPRLIVYKSRLQTYSRGQYDLGCVAMDFIIQAINSNIYTQDKTFLDLVKEGNSLLEIVEKKL